MSAWRARPAARRAGLRGALRRAWCTALPGALLIVACMATAAPASAQPAAATPDERTPETPAAETPAAETPAAETPVEETPDVVLPDARTAPAQGAERAPELRPGVLPALGAVFPGVVVHGTGHFLAGDTPTAMRLLRGQLLALGIAAAGGVPLALTGASRRLSLPAIPLVMGGGGLLLLGWGADIYGAAGLGRVAGTPRLALPGLEARLGYLYVYDPQFAYGSFATPGARLRRGAWHADIDAALALDDDHQRVRVEGGHRFRGPRATGVARDGSALELAAALSLRRHGSEGFATLLGEVVGRSRYDLARVAPSLAGAFADGWLGLGLEVVVYDSVPEAPADWLLGGFGLGMYLGRPEATHGEVRVYYDHFRGELGGGLAVPGGGSGYWGRVGLDGFVAVDPRWAVSFRAEAGSAYLGGVGLVYRTP
jgi:hypothetical protein